MKYVSLGILIGIVSILTSCNAQKGVSNGFSGLHNKNDSVSYAVGVRFGLNTIQQKFADLNNEKVHVGFDECFSQEETQFDKEVAYQIIRDYFGQRKNRLDKDPTDTSAFQRSSLRDSVSYALGYTFGHKTYKQKYRDLNSVAVHKGFDDGIIGESIFNGIVADSILFDYNRDLKEKEAQMNIEIGKAFLEENATKEGVITTESGLQYKVITPAEGPKPVSTDEVKVHYTGTLIDGTKFDSSKDSGQPITFSLDMVIPGWTEGIQLMNEGSTCMLYIPSELAYGPRARGPHITPNSTLIFEVELLEVIKREPPKPSKMGPSEAPDFISFEDNAKKPGIIQTDSGLQYKVITDAEGSKPSATDKVTCHYTGLLVDGTKFDSSLDRGRPAEFPLNRVIKGWTEGLQYMSPGAIYRFYIPYDLAYGEAGRPPQIPPKATLIFDVELLKIN